MERLPINHALRNKSLLAESSWPGEFKLSLDKNIVLLLRYSGQTDPLGKWKSYYTCHIDHTNWILQVTETPCRRVYLVRSSSRREATLQFPLPYSSGRGSTRGGRKYSLKKNVFCLADGSQLLKISRDSSFFRSLANISVTENVHDEEFMPLLILALYLSLKTEAI